MGTFHITEREQTVLGKALLRVEAGNREARARKKKAFASAADGGLGLDWVKGAMELPIENRVSSAELLAAWNQSLAATPDQATAMNAVIRTFAGALDPFAGRRGTTLQELSPGMDLMIWVSDGLNALPMARNQQTGQVDTTDDLELADIEERIQHFIRGTYVMPAALARAGNGTPEERASSTVFVASVERAVAAASAPAPTLASVPQG